MSQALPELPRGRETRLLLATLAVSIGVLLVLAQFRFPAEIASQTAEPAPAPLERLAAGATYDELAGIMADLERRLTPRVIVVRVAPQRPTGEYFIAPRLTRDRAVTLLRPGEKVVAPQGAAVLARDNIHELAVLSVPPDDSGVVSFTAFMQRPGPRYVAVVEGTAQGPVVRPVYIGRTDLIQDPRTGSAMLTVAALQQVLPRGAAIFSLSGNFIGLSTGGESNALLLPADTLEAMAAAARPAPAPSGDLGLDVQDLSASLARVAGVDRGVMVAYVKPGGPAAGHLAPGDVIVSMDGTTVTTMNRFQLMAQSLAPGQQTTLMIVRRGEELTISIAAEDVTNSPATPDAAEPGAVLRAVPGVGAEVVAIRPGSAAAAAGLSPGDIVVRMDDRSAPPPASLERAFANAEPGSGLLLTVQRGLQHRMIALEKR